MKYYLFNILQILGINNMFNEALIASNNLIATGKVNFVCAMFRKKNYIFDDLLMPEILTFCSCAVIHKNWFLTAQRCFIDEDWLVSTTLKPIEKVLSKEVHKIVKIYNLDELTLVKVFPSFNSDPLQLAHTYIRNETTCILYGLSSPQNLPVEGNPNYLLYKVWDTDGDVLKTDVKALFYKHCKKKFNNSLSEYKRQITISTLCINPLPNQYIEPCSFDRGAPIICHNKLQGILIYERPIPNGLSLHLPSGCYGNINQSISLYTESITSKYAKWINKTISVS